MSIQFPEHKNGDKSSDIKVSKLDALAKRLDVLIHIDGVAYGKRPANADDKNNKQAAYTLKTAPKESFDTLMGGLNEIIDSEEDIFKRNPSKGREVDLGDDADEVADPVIEESETETEVLPEKTPVDEKTEVETETPVEEETPSKKTTKKTK